ncbi:MAG: hypothetical protein ACREMO_13065, partial [Gemmatimonadales bacterium]
MPLWLLRLAAGCAAALGAVIILAVAFYLPILRTAARVPGLTRDRARLEADNAKIRHFVAALDSAEARYAQVRQMMGADIIPDPLALASTLTVAPPVRARAPTSGPHYESGGSLPRHWPLDDAGYLTRGQVGTGTLDEAHPGIDVAIPSGSVVRASGGGSVVQT